jgi:hypothetical protein
MAASEPSGNTLPAGFAASYVKVMVDILGRHGADAVLRRSGLEAWIGLPEGPLDAVPLDFTQASALLQALEETLGARGVRSLSRRMSATAFEQVLQPVGAVAAMHDAVFQAFPVERRLKAGLYGLTRTLETLSSVKASTREDAQGLMFHIESCPDCWGRSSSTPACTLVLGLLLAAAAWIAPEADARVDEITCQAQGGSACEFVIRPQSGA